MKRPLLIGLLVTSWLVGANGVRAQPMAEPPGEAAVLTALGRPAAGVSRDDVAIVREQLTPGRWRCTVYSTQSVQLPWGRVPLGQKVETVIIPPRAMAAGVESNLLRSVS